jgi:hypothetical protein
LGSVGKLLAGSRLFHESCSTFFFLQVIPSNVIHPFYFSISHSKLILIDLGVSLTLNLASFLIVLLFQKNYGQRTIYGSTSLPKNWCNAGGYV